MSASLVALESLPVGSTAQSPPMKASDSFNIKKKENEERRSGLRSWTPSVGEMNSEPF